MTLLKQFTPHSLKPLEQATKVLSGSETQWLDLEKTEPLAGIKTLTPWLISCTFKYFQFLKKGNSMSSIVYCINKSVHVSLLNIGAFVLIYCKFPILQKEAGNHLLLTFINLHNLDYPSQCLVYFLLPGVLVEYSIFISIKQQPFCFLVPWYHNKVLYTWVFIITFPHKIWNSPVFQFTLII